MQGFLKLLLLVTINSTCAIDLHSDELLSVQAEISAYRKNTHSKIKHLNEQLAKLENKHAKQLDETEVVGFTAYKDAKEEVDSLDTVHFYQVLITYYPEGYNGYDPATSVFTCPFDGVYFVSVSLERSNDVHAHIVIDGVKQVSIEDRRSELENLQFNSVTNSILVTCLRNELIFVQATDRGTFFGEQGDDERVSTFTVFRLNGYVN